MIFVPVARNQKTRPPRLTLQVFKNYLPIDFHATCAGFAGAEIIELVDQGLKTNGRSSLTWVTAFSKPSLEAFTNINQVTLFNWFIQPVYYIDLL